MKIIADSRMPFTAKLALEQIGEVLFLEKQPYLYDAIASHPDIFFCQIGNQLVTAPNIPVAWENWLQKNDVPLIKGKLDLKEKYPDTAHFNAVVTTELLIHNLKVTDQVIIERVKKLKHIHVNQAYTRCNLISLDEDNFITSDKGIEKQLLLINKKVLFVRPGQIKLQGQPYGFIGGCCGFAEHNLYVCGNHSSLTESDEFQKFVDDCRINIVELYHGSLTDVGSIIFL
ncbi:MAG: hypothetical protein HOO86_14170 [Bacteroidales bacterium]|nr:hypothetical protein [Bacteroidales bacterium]